MIFTLEIQKRRKTDPLRKKKHVFKLDDGTQNNHLRTFMFKALGLKPSKLRLHNIDLVDVGFAPLLYAFQRKIRFLLPMFTASFL